MDKKFSCDSVLVLPSLPASFFKFGRMGCVLNAVFVCNKGCLIVSDCHIQVEIAVHETAHKTIHLESRGFRGAEIKVKFCEGSVLDDATDKLLQSGTKPEA